LIYTLALALFFFLLFALDKLSISLLVTIIGVVAVVAYELLVSLLSMEGRRRELISWSKLTSCRCFSSLAKGGEQVTVDKTGGLVEPLL